mmetsp:Transcript_17269/g.51724  ORF Transcript_17269/g.51724 Transcript_17269/m.51724 type:complete len:306 (-) Transcript_17269:5708-6625(-)
MELLDAALPWVIHLYWVAVTGAALVAAIPMNGWRSFRHAVQLSASRGKLWDGRPRPNLGPLTDASVPQAWFSHFYALGAVCNVFCGWSYLSWLAAQPMITAKQAASAVALMVLQLHLLRRLYESVALMVYPPAARMHAIAYAFGLSYYAVLSASQLPTADGRRLLQWPSPATHGSLADLRDLWPHLASELGLPTVAGLLVFGFGNWLQHQSHCVLARLSSNSQQHTYRIPNGGAFKMVSCPHYLGEIVIYVGLLVIQRGAHLNSWLILAWVVCNLVLAAGATHAWYRRQFKAYPPSRKALVPLVW